MRVDAGQQFRTLPDQEDALAQQRAHGTHVGRVNVSRGYAVGAQQMSELLGVDPVVLVLATVNEMDVKSVGQNKSQAGSLAGVGEPIPAEHAFRTDRQVMLIGRDELEEIVEVVVSDVGVEEFFALAIHDANVHLTSVQIDSAVELRGGSIILHMLTQ